jgi:hypothetical protein
LTGRASLTGSFHADDRLTAWVVPRRLLLDPLVYLELGYRAKQGLADGRGRRTDAARWAASVPTVNQPAGDAAASS